MKLQEIDAKKQEEKIKFEIEKEKK